MKQTSRAEEERLYRSLSDLDEMESLHAMLSTPWHRRHFLPEPERKWWHAPLMTLVIVAVCVAVLLHGFGVLVP